MYLFVICLQRMHDCIFKCSSIAFAVAKIFCFFLLPVASSFSGPVCAVEGSQTYNSFELDSLDIKLIPSVLGLGHCVGFLFALIM